MSGRTCPWAPGTEVTWSWDLIRDNGRTRPLKVMRWMGYPPKSRSRGILEEDVARCKECGTTGVVKRRPIKPDWLLPIKDDRITALRALVAQQEVIRELGDNERRAIHAKYQGDWESARKALDASSITVMAKSFAAQIDNLIKEIQTTSVQEVKP